MLLDEIMFLTPVEEDEQHALKEQIVQNAIEYALEQGYENGDERAIIIWEQICNDVDFCAAVDDSGRYDHFNANYLDQWALPILRGHDKELYPYAYDALYQIIEADAPLFIKEALNFERI